MARAFATSAAVLLLSSCTTGEEPVAQATSATAAPSRTSEPADEPTVPDLTRESCQAIESELAGAREALSAAGSDLGSVPEAFGQVAENLRAAAADAVDDVAAAAEQLAAAYDEIAAQVRSGDILNLDLGSLEAPLTTLGQVCNS